MNNEIRTREVGFNIDNEKNTFAGMPIVFNQMSEVLYDFETHKYFREVIAPEALSQEFIDTQDVLLVLNHDRDKVLARRKCGKGSLNLITRDNGVYFETKVPNTQLGRDTFEQIQREEYTNMSFAFIDGRDKGDITWDFNTEDNIPVRTVHKIYKLVDCAIVYQPAYSQTSVTARSIDDEYEEQQRTLKVKVEVEIEKDDKEKEKECEGEVKTEVVDIAEVPENEIYKIEENSCGDSEKREVDENYLELLKPYKEIINSI